MNSNSTLTGLLVDTWWYGLTSRMPESTFRELAELRAEQGYNAIQMVAGIPPEVGPENSQGWSDVGTAWQLDGSMNGDYLKHARKRITLLNELGLRVIVYGAWGHQIDWAGKAFMIEWWQTLVEHLDDLDVIYCLTGEVGLWIGQAGQLLPDKSTDDLKRNKFTQLRSLPAARLGKRIIDAFYWRAIVPRLVKKRYQQWADVLESLHQQTERPIILHTNSDHQARDCLPNAHLLAANTTQTGHSRTSQNLLWQQPLDYLESQPEDLFINLEPWYEGIRDDFWGEDQLFAYWVSMLAGASSFCYGAQGIWNMGDGEFLAHWGKQTYNEAKALDTPDKLGKSHALFMQCWRPGEGDAEVDFQQGKLISISRKNKAKEIIFFPDISSAKERPKGTIWLPLEGRVIDKLPDNGQAVIIIE